MKRIGIFGGSFDPVHCGHLALARSALKELKLNYIYFVPARISPLKRARLHSPRHRVQMLRLALRGIPQLKISQFEVHSPGPSYTIRTLEYFHRRHPRSQIFFLMGSDSLKNFDRWKNWKKVLELCALAVARRRGESAASGKLLKRLGSRVQFLKSAAPLISSTAVRSGRFHPSKVPREVLEYIHAKRLYQ